ncbi:MAG: CHRD domain-containing protein [Hyphomicrobiales bacterium]|nr:CHRD domain-containing protein [Hyphomicrobiales bacterium]
MRCILVLAALAAFAVPPALRCTSRLGLPATRRRRRSTAKATGTCARPFDPVTKTLGWTVDYSGLTGPALAADFHGPAGPGVAAPIEAPPIAPLDDPMKGSAVLTDSQVKDLMGGMMYFNIDTAEHKPGEIRSQMEEAM